MRTCRRTVIRNITVSLRSENHQYFSLCAVLFPRPMSCPYISFSVDREKVGEEKEGEA